MNHRRRLPAGQGRPGPVRAGYCMIARSSFPRRRDGAGVGSADQGSDASQLPGGVAPRCNRPRFGRHGAVDDAGRVSPHAGDSLRAVVARLVESRGSREIAARTRMQEEAVNQPPAESTPGAASSPPAAQNCPSGGTGSRCCSLQDLLAPGRQCRSEMPTGLPPTWPGSWNCRNRSMACTPIAQPHCGLLFPAQRAQSGMLGRFGQESCLVAQAGEIDVASGGASSSIPGKNNPAVAENLVALARFNAALVSGMHQAPIHEQERTGSAWITKARSKPMFIERCRAALACLNPLSDACSRSSFGCRGQSPKRCCLERVASAPTRWTISSGKAKRPKCGASTSTL